MTTINFVSKAEVSQEQRSRVRHLVVMITTGMLVVYLVGVAGVFGWWWYWSSREKKTSAEVVSYLSQIAQYSDAEVAVRRLGARAQVVADFLANRGQASEAASILVQASEVQVTGWDYDASGSQTVGVKSAGPGQIFTFTRFLADKYNLVQPDEIGWNVTEGWYGRVLLAGRKKGQI